MASLLVYLFCKGMTSFIRLLIWNYQKYLLFEAYPIVYMEIRGMSAGPAGLAFLSILIGAIIACFVCLRYQSVYLNDVAKREGEYVPELRLKQGFLGGPLVVISMFWLGWTGYKANIHW